MEGTLCGEEMERQGRHSSVCWKSVHLLEHKADSSSRNLMVCLSSPATPELVQRGAQFKVLRYRFHFHFSVFFFPPSLGISKGLKQKP